MIPINNAGVGLPDNQLVEPFTNTVGGSVWLPLVLIAICVVVVIVGYIYWMRRG